MTKALEGITVVVVEHAIVAPYVSSGLACIGLCVVKPNAPRGTSREIATVSFKSAYGSAKGHVPAFKSRRVPGAKAGRRYSGSRAGLHL